MAVESTLNTKAYAGDSVTTLFDTTYVFFDTSDLQVRVTNNTTGNITLLVENTSYTVTGGDGTAGTINLGGGSSPFGALQSGTTLTILRVVPATQPVDFVNNDNSDAEVAERALDRLTMLSQQNLETIGRALRLPVGDVSGSSMELPSATTRASKVLGFDSSGLLTYLTPTTSVTDASSLNWTQTGTGAQSRSVQDRLRDSVSVFDFMTAAQIADVRAGTALQDVTSAIQAAMNVSHNVYCPAGTYKLSATLTVPNRAGFVLTGEYYQTIFKMTVAGSTPILTFPTGLGTSGYGIVEGITFTASGAGAGNAIGVSAPGAYTFSMDFRHCTFHSTLRKGVIGTYLMCDFYRCDFGTRNAASGTYKAIELIGNATFESVVSFRYCEIADCNDTIAMEFDFCDQIRLEGCVIEPNSASTATIMVRDTLGFTMEWCWAEGNGAVPLVKGADGAHSPVDTRFEFNRCHLEGNASGANDVILDVSTGTGTKSIITNNVLANFTHAILYAGPSYNLPGTGVNQCLAWYNNKCFGGTMGFLSADDYTGGFANYRGTLSNDDAPAGHIGEFVESKITSFTNFPATTVYGDLTSITLTAGDWDVWGSITAALNGATLTIGSICAITTTAGNNSAGIVDGDTASRGTNQTATASVTHGVAIRMKLSAASTTVYLKYRQDYSAGTPQAAGFIRARRRR
jgi:hypothetical protein